MLHRIDIPDWYIEITKGWTQHALERFIERCSDYEFPPEEFAKMIPRIETCWRVSFATPFFQSRRFVCIAINMFCHKHDKFVKVKLIYNHRDKVVITALPYALEMKRLHHTVRLLKV